MAATADFERGVVGATVATTDPGSHDPWDAFSAAANTTAKYASDATRGKVLQFVSAAAGGAYTSFVTWNSATLGTSVTEHYGRLYIKPTVNLNGDRIVRMFGAVGASAAHVVVWTDNTVRLYDSALVARASGAVVLVNGKWNRVEWHVIHSTTVGLLEARIFVGDNADGLTPDETLSIGSVNTGATFQQLDFGLGDNDANMNFALDSVAGLVGGWPGPITSDVPHLIPRMPGLVHPGVFTNRLYVPPVLPVPVSGGVLRDLAAAPAGIATVSASLSVSRPLAAAPAGAATVTANLKATRAIAAAVAGVATIVANLKVTRRLNAAPAGTATVTANLIVKRFLQATVVGTGTVTATLRAARPIAASVTGTGTVTGSLKVTRQIQATMAGTSTVTGNLKVTRTLAATPAGVGTVTVSSLSVARKMNAVIGGTSTATASKLTLSPLALRASVSGTTTINANITLVGAASGGSDEQRMLVKVGL